MENKDIIDKVFLFGKEEWVVEDILTYGYKCSCRNLNTDETKLFNVEFVEQKIRLYEKDFEKMKKEENAFNFEEDDEKNLLMKIVSSFCQKDLSNMSLEDLIALKKIKKEIGLE